MLAVFFVGLVAPSESFAGIQKHARNLDSDEYVIVDGNPFFPIGIYSVNHSN